jgi:hypothetical protein
MIPKIRVTVDLEIHHPDTVRDDTLIECLRLRLDDGAIKKVDVVHILRLSDDSPESQARLREINLALDRYYGEQATTEQVPTCSEQHTTMPPIDTEGAKEPRPFPYDPGDD